jgi:tetratricopeptide (TPR) repeat protein
MCPAGCKRSLFSSTGADRCKRGGLEKTIPSLHLSFHPSWRQCTLKTDVRSRIRGPQKSGVADKLAAWCKLILPCVLFFNFAAGCATLVIDPLVDPLTKSLQRQTDLQLVTDGTPTLLLMLDGFLAEHPDNTKLLLAATQAYSAYASTLQEFGNTERAVVLSAKAKKYSTALLRLPPAAGNKPPKALADFSKHLQSFTKRDVPSLFWGGYGWATWIKLQDGAPAALADLPKVEQIMRRVLALDESYYYGAAHIFLGYYYGSLPPMLGGKPAESRRHFERALQIADRRFLLAQVTFAESYARQTFDRELFKDLLTEVIDYQGQAGSDLASSNALAKLRAQKLLDHIDDYF